MPNPSWTEPIVPFNTVVNSFRPARCAMPKTIEIRMARFRRSLGDRNSARQRRRREKALGASCVEGDSAEIEDEDENEDEDELLIDFWLLLLFATVDPMSRRRGARRRRPGCSRNTLAD